MLTRHIDGPTADYTLVREPHVPTCLPQLYFREDLAVPFNRASGWLRPLPKNFGIRCLIRIEPLRLRVRGNQNEVDAPIVSQPSRTGISRPGLGKWVWIAGVQVAYHGFVQLLLLAVGCAIDLLRGDSL